MRVRILYHDHCFDGAASAAYFSRFIEAKFHPEAQFAYTGLAHVASQLFDPGMFDGDENAIVDFKYSTDPRLTWWFDHHQSAFLTPEDAEHFRHDTTGRKMYDPSFRSCTKYIATVAKERFGFDAPDLAAQRAVAEQAQQRFFDTVPFLLLGRMQQPTAFRSDIKDLVSASFPVFWGVRRG